MNIAHKKIEQTYNVKSN